MKAVIDSESSVKNQDELTSAEQLFKPKNKSALFSIAMCAALLFVFINITSILYESFTENKKVDPNNSLNKLKHFVKESAYESEKYGPWHGGWQEPTSIRQRLM